MSDIIDINPGKSFSKTSLPLIEIGEKEEKQSFLPEGYTPAVLLDISNAVKQVFAAQDKEEGVTPKEDKIDQILAKYPHPITAPVLAAIQTELQSAGISVDTVRKRLEPFIRMDMLA